MDVITFPAIILHNVAECDALNESVAHMAKKIEKEDPQKAKSLRRFQKELDRVRDWMAGKSIYVRDSRHVSYHQQPDHDRIGEVYDG